MNEMKVMKLKHVSILALALAASFTLSSQLLRAADPAPASTNAVCPACPMHPTIQACQMGTCPAGKKTSCCGGESASTNMPPAACCTNAPAGCPAKHDCKK
jgi:hypothetical protein